MSHFCLLPNDNSGHSLLEPPSPAYTSVTVRRAFIVWLHCGQQNEFRHVCNYFHRLEALEDRLSAEGRATSRLHEFKLLSTQPPSSQFLNGHFPKLYRHNKNNKISVTKLEEVKEIKLEDCVFNLEGFHDMKIQKGVTTRDIIKTSQLIRTYCKSHSKSLKTFLAEFQKFAKITESVDSVNNIAMFIKKRHLKDELETWKNLPKTFGFLDSFEEVITDVDNTKPETTEIDKCPNFVDHTFNANKNANQIRILINESRRKEMINLVPSFSELSIKQCNNKINSNQAIISPTVTNIKKSSIQYDLVTKRLFTP